MSKDKFCTSIDEVYGAGWFSRNEKELEKYEWEFRWCNRGERFVRNGWNSKPADHTFKVIPEFDHSISSKPLIVILGEKKPVDKVKQMYGKTLSELTPPAGYEFTGEFRPTEVGEYWFVGSSASRASAKDDLCVLILRKKPDPIAEVYGKPLSEIKIPEGWDYAGEFRVPSVGEEYLSVYESRFCMDSLRETGGQSRLILCKKKDPIEEVYGCPLSELKAPEGFEFTGEFRNLTNQGEWFLNKNTLEATSSRSCSDLHLMRLILKKLPPPPTIASVYDTPDPAIPAGWVKTGEFRPPFPEEACLHPYKHRVQTYLYQLGPKDCRIILRRITLTDIYGSSTVTLPAGYDWTGEFRPVKAGEVACTDLSKAAEEYDFDTVGFRLILRPTTRKKVRFAAEEKKRRVKEGEYFFDHRFYFEWIKALHSDSDTLFICATREETPDLTPQVVTQADVDKIWEGK